jgi:ABC-2 type transport system permease protein
MNRAVLVKSLRDSLTLLVALTVAILILELAVVRMLVESSKNLEQLRTWLELPLIRSLLRIILGADIVGDLTPTTMATFGLAHPLLWAFSWTLLLAIGSGVLAGEIDRGTADLLLTLPLSRTAVYVSTSAVCGLAAVLASAAPLAGLALAQRAWPLKQPLDFARLYPVAVNFLALNLAVGGVTLMVSSWVSRRGRAVGLVLAGLLVSDLINLLAEFWEIVRPVRFLGFLYFYRPLPVVRSGELPWRDISILLAVGAVTWLAGWWRFSHRDIPAV